VSEVVQGTYLLGVHEPVMGRHEALTTFLSGSTTMQHGANPQQGEGVMTIESVVSRST
jgi:hypothetical protein